VDDEDIGGHGGDGQRSHQGQKGRNFASSEISVAQIENFAQVLV